MVRQAHYEQGTHIPFALRACEEIGFGHLSRRSARYEITVFEAVTGEKLTSSELVEGRPRDIQRKRRVYNQPSGRGYERQVAERIRHWWGERREERC